MPEVRTQSSISTGLQIVLLQQIAVEPFFCLGFWIFASFQKGILQASCWYSPVLCFADVAYEKMREYT